MFLTKRKFPVFGCLTRGTQETRKVAELRYEPVTFHSPLTIMVDVGLYPGLLLCVK